MFVAAAPARSGGAGVLVGVIVAVFLAMTVLGGAAFFVFRSRSASTTNAVAAAPEGGNGTGEAWSDLDAAVPISSRDPSWGARAAPVTLVVFSDLECPFCAKYTTTIAGAKEKYGPGKLRVVWKHYPLAFHKQARPAAIAAEAVFRLGGSKAFWAFHDAAFANRTELTQGNFERWAAAAGVDVPKFRDMQLDPAVAAKVAADAELAKSVGVKGTPATFVNGFLVSGAQPPEKVSSVIDAELSAARPGSTPSWLVDNPRSSPGVGAPPRLPVPLC